MLLTLLSRHEVRCQQTIVAGKWRRIKAWVMCAIGHCSGAGMRAADVQNEGSA